jgi:hypothetical protein
MNIDQGVNETLMAQNKALSDVNKQLVIALRAAWKLASGAENDPEARGKALALVHAAFEAAGERP